MNFSSVGDLAQNLMLRRQSSGLGAQINRLTEEVVTGRAVDMGRAVGGDFSVPASLQRSLAVNDAFADVRKTIGGQLAAQQTALDAISVPISDLGARVLSDLNSGNDERLRVGLRDARTEFKAAVSGLNTQYGGKSLFSGAAPESAALADAETILSDVAAAAAGATSAADFVTAIDDWFFAPGGGFETSGYLGSPAGQTGIPIDETTRIGPLTAADAPEIRAVLRDLAILSLAPEGVAGGDPVATQDAIKIGAQQLLGSHQQLVGLRADIGATEAQIEQSDTRSGAERFALEKARNELTAVDPYKAATELEAARASLETLFIVTSRTSRLSLADYLR